MKSRDDPSLVEFGYRCLTKEQLLPPGNPIWCKASKTRLGVFNIECCDAYDYCKGRNGGEQGKYL
jgi:hypothetical protein